MDNGFERITRFSPAFDKRSDDPEKNYGIHGCELRMVLKKDGKAVQFLLYTAWYPKSVDITGMPSVMLKPMPADLGYHSPDPMRDDQYFSEDCEYIGKCYYDGSGLDADEPYQILLEKGSDGVWEFLEDYYNRTFGEENEDE